MIDRVIKFILKAKRSKAKLKRTLCLLDLWFVRVLKGHIPG